MKIIFIIAVLGLLIYYGRKKKKRDLLEEDSSITKISDKTQVKPKTNKQQFPDRINAFEWHQKAIKRGFDNGDLDLVNLSYAKLIESIRQQNLNGEDNYDDYLEVIRLEYEKFRVKFDFEYPEQFLPPNQRNKNSKIEFKSNNKKLNLLVKEINSQSHPKYPLLRKEYEPISNMPYRDFSNWIIEQLKLKDYDSLFSFLILFYQITENYEEKELKKDLTKFLTIDFNSILNIESQAILEIQAFFILERGIGSLNREFWISEGKESELLCKILSVYSFSINKDNFKRLVNKANKFLREMRKETDYWKDYKNYNLEKLSIDYQLETKTDLPSKLKKLSSGERLHFFDFPSIHNYQKFWNGESSYKTRSYGINENESLENISILKIFEKVNDISSIKEIAKKADLKERAEKEGFEIKKSWTLLKIYDNLAKTENGQNFLKDYISDKNVLAFKENYQFDLNQIFKHQTEIKKITDLISMI